ncbi:hypothetical protein Efla_004181 [Eimeria flavescens]
MHCSTRQKTRITEIVNDILGDSVYRCNPTTRLPSPESLLECFLIKSKVINELGEFVEEGDEEDLNMDALELQLSQELETENLNGGFLHANENASEFAGCSDSRPLAEGSSSTPLKKSSSNILPPSSPPAAAPAALAAAAAATPSGAPSQMPSGTEAPGDSKADRAASKIEKLKAFQRNICLRGKKLKSFSHPRNPMDICSMNESKLLRLAKQSPVELCLFHQKHLSRIYPAGTRISSSNFNPIISWSLGAQIVALNLQSLGLATMLNHGRFQDNGGAQCGYVLKPKMLRDPEHPFDAISATPREPHALHLTIKVLSAHQLPRPAAEGLRARSAALKKLTTRSKQYLSPFIDVSVHGPGRMTAAAANCAAAAAAEWLLQATLLLLLIVLLLLLLLLMELLLLWLVLLQLLLAWK